MKMCKIVAQWMMASSWCFSPLIMLLPLHTILWECEDEIEKLWSWWWMIGRMGNKKSKTKWNIYQSKLDDGSNWWLDNKSRKWWEKMILKYYHDGAKSMRRRRKIMNDDSVDIFHDNNNWNGFKFTVEIMSCLWTE